MTGSSTTISNWYWAFASATCGLMVIWLVENPQNAKTILLLFYSPLLLLLLSVAAAFRQMQLQSFIRGPAIWLAISTLLFCAVQMLHTDSLAAFAFAWLYAIFTVAGFWSIVGPWLRERSNEAVVP